MFGTAELLEKILVKLHPFNLARAARVCTHWQDLVSSSKKLQRGLFLLPVQDTLAYFHPDPTTSDRHGSGIWSSSPYSIEPTRVFINPLALARPDLFLPGGRQGFISTPAAFTYRTTDLTTGASFTTPIPGVNNASTSNNAAMSVDNASASIAIALPSVYHPSASDITTASVNNPSAAQRAHILVLDFFGKDWQRMLFTQPPMGDVAMRWRDQMGLSKETPTVDYDAENELFKGVSMV